MEAMIDYNKAIELNSKSLLAHNNRGFIYIKLGKYNKAISSGALEYMKLLPLDVCK